MRVFWLNERVSAPNPNLPPEHSKNFQTRLAYYFSGRSPGQLAAAFSQNHIRNLRETFDFTASEFGVEDEEFATYTFRTTRISAEARVPVTRPPRPSGKPSKVPAMGDVGDENDG